MKPLLPVAALLVAALVALPTALGLAQEPLDPPITPPRWEYRVVGIVELHGSTLDYLKDALEEHEGGIVGFSKALDAQLHQKTEDLLNELGAEGWELIQIDSTSVVLKRPGR